MRVIAVANQKGGQAKTTSTVQLAGALAKRRTRRGQPLRVLVIDLDAQRDATDLLAPGLDAQLAGPPPAPSAGEEPPPPPPPAPGTLEVLLEGRPLAEVIVPTESGVLLCPAQAGLAGLDVLLGTRRDRPRRLREALALGLREWDLVLLDCPPALGLATVNALVAADCVLTPIMPEYLAVKAVGPLSLSIGNAVVHNPALKHLGFLLTRVNVREALTEETRRDLRAMRLPEAAGAPLWRTFIPVDTRLKGFPVRRGRGVEAYERAADELLARLRRLYGGVL